MAFRLSGAQRKERDQHLANIMAASGDVSNELAACRKQVAHHIQRLNVCVHALNNIVARAHGFAESVASDAEDEIEEKTESWKESERGEAAVSWAETWRSVADALGDHVEDAVLPDVELDHVDQVMKGLRQLTDADEEAG